jgi:HK97 family phage portal protein
MKFQLSKLFRAIASPFSAKASPRGLSGVPDRGWHVIRDIFTGAWQRHIEVDQATVLANWALFSCMTLIAADIGKLRLKLVERDSDGIWTEINSPAFSPVLRKPNHFQTRQKFIEQWIVSKLSAGNTYVLKERDQRGVVVRMYVLDPSRCQPLVAKNGDVYYQLQDDDLSGVPTGLPAVPASEIIHDTMVCLFHPLVGISPIYACGLAATQGLNIQNNSANFFANGSQPGGILTAPAEITDETAARLKAHWEKNYTGDNVGKIAVLGDGLKYEAMAVKAVDAQLVDQLKMTAEMVCSTFHVPAFKIGAGTIPAGQKVDDLNQIYYADCLQALIESLEALLDDGLGLTRITDRPLGTEFELDDLLRMDTTTLTKALSEQVKASIASPDEARKRMNLGPVPGGRYPLAQQQNYSLEALSKRDAGPDPFGKQAAAPAPAPAPADPPMKEFEAIVVKVMQSFEKQSDTMSSAVATFLATQQKRDPTSFDDERFGALMLAVEKQATATSTLVADVSTLNVKQAQDGAQAQSDAEFEAFTNLLVKGFEACTEGQYETT